MDIKDHQQKVLEVKLYEGIEFSKDMSILSYLTHCLSEETGEFSGVLKRVFRDGNGTITENDDLSLKKELGDIYWCLAAICDNRKWDIDEILRMNFEKVHSRVTRNTLRGSGDSR